MEKKSLKGTWSQAIGTFLTPILIVFVIRWLLIEPFVIPSGSMIPNLLIHDHVLVKKFSFGVKVPFMDHWLVRWGAPQSGQVLVFKFPDNPDVYYIKRLIGLPGDEVTIKGNGQIFVNGKEWTLTGPTDSQNDGFNYYIENSGRETHTVRFYDSPTSIDTQQVVKVPEGHYFFMGDNRDQSNDGRVWGVVPEKYLVGPAFSIWLSCENTLTSVSYICDPLEIRWPRLFKSVQ